VRTPYLEPSGPRVALRPIGRADEAEVIAVIRASADLYHPWMSMLPRTPAEYREFMTRFDQPSPNVGLVVCDRADDAIVGGININNIVQGRFQSAALGYWASASVAGRGYMSEAIKLVFVHAFGPLGLHRLEANIQPANHASIRVVTRNGFRYEGYSPDYLFIDGAWRGHERWAITREMAEAVG